MDIPITISRTLASLSTDVFILAICFAVFLVFGLYFGKGKLISLLLAFYPAAFLFSIFPYLSLMVPAKTAPLQQVVIESVVFGVFFLAIYYFLQRLIWLDFSFSTVAKFVEAGILSLSGVILVILYMKVVVPFGGVYSFSGWIAPLFATKNLIFWWFFAPLVALFFISRR